MINRRDQLNVVLLCALIVCLALSLMFPPKCDGQEFRMAKDTFTGYDKIAHMGASSLLYLGILRMTEDNKSAVLGTLILGIMFEVKDGYIKYEDFGWWGGDGFSWKDIFADAIGIAVAQIVLRVFDAPIFISATHNGLEMRMKF